MLKLVIGNKNYSSWSMRPWVLMRQFGIPFDEIPLKFDDHVRVIGIEQYSAAGKVPVLLVDDMAVWDTLAIAETLAELFPQKLLWPQDPVARRLARSACAEMHAGFQFLRSQMPMNIRAALPGRGMNAEVQHDIERIVALWRTCRATSGEGDLLFGRFTIADAFFAPVVMRFITYGVALPADAEEYVTAVRSLPAVQAWMDEALRETAIVLGDEPYASP
jgi:glutathione S-transferase